MSDSTPSQPDISGKPVGGGRIMGGLEPPAIHATAAEVPPEPIDALRPQGWTIFSGDTPWWRPDAGNIARALGWWWLLLIPLLLGSIAIIVGTVISWRRGVHFDLGLALKACVFFIAAAVTIVLRAARRGVQLRKDNFCIHCGYSLDNLGDEGTCPECGRAFSRRITNEFRKDPHFFAARHAVIQRAPRFEPFRAGDGPTPADGTS